MTDQRLGPAPVTQRHSGGPVLMGARPDRSGGARVKGTYTLAPDEFRYVWNPEYVPPQWADELGGLFLSWGPPFWGDPSAFRGEDVFDRGATLWSLDADDNPVPVDQVTAIERRPGAFFDQVPKGDLLGERAGAVQLVQQPEHLSTRYYSGEHHLHNVNEWTVRALRVEDGAIVQGDAWDITMLTDDEPSGALITTGVFPVFTTSRELADADFVFDLQRPAIAGLRADRALLIALSQPIGADSTADPYYIVVWGFDPFHPNTLKDPSYPTITRQPDVRISIGLIGDFGSMYVSRRSDSEAVVIFSDPDTGVQVYRLSDSGTVLGTSSAAWETQSFSGFVQPQYMGAGIVHSGDLRIDDGAAELGLPTPHFSLLGTSLTGVANRIDDSRYLYIRRNPIGSELSFLTRTLTDDSDVGVVVSDGALDVEVFALAEQLVRPAGPFGAVDEGLWATYRLPGAYNELAQVITIELGGSRGLAQVLTDSERYFRLPEGLVKT